MKKRLFFILLFLLSLFLALFASPAYAATDDNIDTEIGKHISDGVNGLDLSSLEEIYACYASDKSLGATVKDMISRLIDGESLSFNQIMDEIFAALGGEWSSYIPLAAAVVGLTLLSALAGRFSADFKQDGTKKIIRIATYGATVAIVSAVVGATVVDVKSTLEAIGGLSTALFPLMLTLTAAVGGATAVARLQPLIAFGGSAVTGIALNIVLPLFIASFVFSVVGNLSKTVSLSKLTKTTRAVGGWVLGITFSVFAFILSISGIIGLTSDSISIKSAKFALSSYVPILGGYLANGFDVVLAAGVLIKNAVGVVGLILLAGIVLIPAVKLVALSLILRFSAAVVEPMGDAECSDFLYATGKGLNILIAVLLGVAFVFSSLIVAVVATFNSGVV